MAPIQSDENCSPDTYGPKFCPASQFTCPYTLHCDDIIDLLLFLAWGNFYKYKTSMEQKFLIEIVIINLVCSLTDVSFIMVVYGENALGATEELSLQYHKWQLGKTGYKAEQLGCIHVYLARPKSDTNITHSALSRRGFQIWNVRPNPVSLKLAFFPMAFGVRLHWLQKRSLIHRLMRKLHHFALSFLMSLMVPFTQSSSPLHHSTINL